MGVRVDLADSGLDAMAKLELHPPDHYSALLIDLMMPGLDGYETTRMIRANHRFDHLPIIALSAQDDPDSLGSCVEAGMNGHVAKPLDADRLWDVLIKSVVADAGGGFVSSAAAGRKMPARPRQSSESSTAAVLFDPQPLDRLRSKVAPDRFDAMLRLLLEDCRVQVARLRQCACGGDFSALRQYAHDLCSTAGHAGMLQLGDLGRELLRGVSRSDDEMVLRIVSQIEVVAAESINVLLCCIMKEMDREALVE
ncbi:response regulator [Neopusillimonas aromaticivorans]|uniref:response regulator n=1 Tax=Neopusillimonas aromaticivorans TaxID=2979868 RepID=UPI002595361C|nr:response regulator [Neopusillimonas aromaticivorans]WJJ94289.1 response regulator [Neopusillimonas aromaticivorans]